MGARVDPQRHPFDGHTILSLSRARKPSGTKQCFAGREHRGCRATAKSGPTSDRAETASDATQYGGGMGGEGRIGQTPTSPKKRRPCLRCTRLKRATNWLNTVSRQILSPAVFRRLLLCVADAAHDVAARAAAPCSGPSKFSPRGSLLAPELHIDISSLHCLRQHVR